ncbi:MAG TPA: HEAT repeat domain-containing protein [Kofleriaceae bacterium]|nr:HEAT repeat domain-containing protein [Kofleriaceae bacterium]
MIRDLTQRLLGAGLSLGLIAGVAHPAHANFDWAGHVELDAEGLSSDDATRRFEAVSDLSKYDIVLTQNYLLQALGDGDDKVKVAAAKALGLGGATAAVPTMVTWLTDPDPKIKQVAADVLGEIGGTEATSALTRSLGDSDPMVRMHAVKALGAIGRRGHPVIVISLIPRLEDDKADVRIATIAQLEELGDRRAVIPLVARFGDTAPEARRCAVRAVGQLGDPSAVPALVRLMNDPNDEVKTAAVGSLGLLGAIDAIDALTEQLSTGSDTYRQKVAYALGQIAAVPGSGKAGEDAMRTLVQNLEVTTTRNAAREALHVAGKAAVPALVAHLQGRIHGDPASAVDLLADAGDPRATATLAAELERGRVAMPRVLKALGATGDPQALVPVLGALASKDTAIRLAAMEALHPLLGSDARAGDVLVEHLSDDDLEIRVLAAEYLGTLGVGSAAGKLTALSGAGNPMRLRHAAIDALGEIGRAGHLPPASDATKALIDVLREGPTELHASAATALSYIANPAALPQLSVLARSDHGPTRYEVVRAIGATLRGHADPGARKLLRELIDDSSAKVALAAIAGLAAASSLDDAATLRTMVDQAPADRRRAAAWALGEMHDAGSLDVLLAAMSSKDDRLAGDAAWAAGEILAGTRAEPTDSGRERANAPPAQAAQAAQAPAVQAPGLDSHAGTVVDRWLHLIQYGGWAGSINSAAGLARLIWALPKPVRAELLTKPRHDALLDRTFHKSRLVRINIAHALAAVGDDHAVRALAQELKDDPSPHVRMAVARALHRIGGARAIAALKLAGDVDKDPLVRSAAKTAPGSLPPRSEWRTFYVVDPSAGDARIRQEPYFVHSPDDIVWASYTDARGELTTEHIPGETSQANVLPASHEAEY